MTFLASPFWANPFLANPFLMLLRGCVVCRVFVCCVLCFVFCVLCVVFGAFSPPSARPPSSGPPSSVPPSCVPPSAGPEKIRSFFPSHSHFRSSCVSPGVFSLNFGCVFDFCSLQMCPFGLSDCRVKPRRASATRSRRHRCRRRLWGRWGFTRQPENSKRAHLTAPALQTPPKFHQTTPRESRKNENCGGRG